MYEFRCDERLNTKNEESTLLTDTGLNMTPKNRDEFKRERFESLMVENDFIWSRIKKDEIRGRKMSSLNYEEYVSLLSSNMTPIMWC